MSGDQNIYEVSYTHVASNSQSAARAARYITRRPEERGENGREPTRESDWREIEYIGDREQFKEVAGRRREEKLESARERGTDLSRDRSAGAASYLHIVVSPENRGHEMRDQDFYRLAEQFTRAEDGRQYSHVAAVHRDGDHDHDHLHILVARDKIPGKELEQAKDRCDEMIRDIERERGIERHREPEREHQRQPEREPSRER